MLETTNIRLPSCFPPHCTQHSRGSSSLQSSSPAPSPPDDDGNGNDDGNDDGNGNEDDNYDDEMMTWLRKVVCQLPESRS